MELNVTMNPHDVTKTWIYRGLCDLFFAFDSDDVAFEDNATFSEIMGLEKFLKAVLLLECHAEYESLPLVEAQDKVNKIAMGLGHKFTNMIDNLSKLGMADIEQIKQLDFDGYTGAQLINAVEAGYMETRYPVPKPVSDKFPIKNTDFTHDPLSSSGITKFIYALCNACFHRLASNIDFTKMQNQFRDTFQHRESFNRFNSMFWEQRSQQNPKNKLSPTEAKK